MSLTITGVTPGGSIGKTITLNLSHHRKARIWLGELPDLSYPGVEVLERQQDAKASTIAEIKYAAVEIFAPKGVRALYGLLGAKFTPDNLEQLLVQVAFCGDTAKQVEWSLAAKVDKIYAGLTSEYAPSVLDGALRVAETLGSGVLRFECAAHGVVGSSPKIFRQLATISVELLTARAESLSEEELTALISIF